MKLCPAEKLIEFLEPEPETVARANQAFQRVAIPYQQDPAWLPYAVSEGFLQVTQINHAGKPAFIVWYHVKPVKILVIECAQSVTTDCLFDVLATGGDLLARQLGCHTIEFRTRRTGLIVQAPSFGYRATAIVLTKFVS